MVRYYFVIEIPISDPLATFGSLVRQVEKILYTPKRASSLVESFNSKLRTAQYVKKHVSQVLDSRVAESTCGYWR